MALGVISSHEPPGALVTVTKSAVMKMLETPSSAVSSAAMGLSAGLPATKVAGPPTGLPTMNFIALGLGVGVGLIAIAC